MGEGGETERENGREESHIYKTMSDRWKKEGKCPTWTRIPSHTKSPLHPLCFLSISSPRKWCNSSTVYGIFLICLWSHLTPCLSLVSEIPALMTRHPMCVNSGYKSQISWRLVSFPNIPPPYSCYLLYGWGSSGHTPDSVLFIQIPLDWLLITYSEIYSKYGYLLLTTQYET